MGSRSHSAHHVGGQRIRAIDPLRGLAMVLVIAQHAYHFVHPETASELLGTAIYTGTRMASVAFMAISGMMISYFLQTRASPHEVVVRYRRRAVFLLLAAHPAIQLARFFNVDTEGNTPVQELIHRMMFDFPITDTIALCLLVAPALLLRLRRNQVAMLAGLLLVGTLPVMIFWQPESAVGRVAQEVFFGWRSNDRVLSIGWPLIPWLGIFLFGSLAGQLLGDVQLGRSTLEQLIRRLIRAAVPLFGTGVVLVAGYKLLRTHAARDLAESTFQILYPNRTSGLLPIYFSILVLLLAFFLWYVDLRGRYDRAVWALSIFGRTSLFTYVTQFLFVHSLPAHLGLRGSLGILQIAALTAFAAVATWCCAYAYGRLRGWIAIDDYRALVGMRGSSVLTPVVQTQDPARGDRTSR